MKTRKALKQARAEWLRIAELRATEVNPKLAGRMDWDTAVYLFNTGLDPVEAGNRLARSTPWDKPS